MDIFIKVSPLKLEQLFKFSSRLDILLLPSVRVDYFLLLHLTINVNRVATIMCDSALLQFSYTGSDGDSIHVVQLNFLKLLSATAKQTFTYHCLNSAAWLHTATYSNEHALRFRGSNGEELTHENTHYISALYDGCQVSHANTHYERSHTETHVVLIV